MIEPLLNPENNRLTVYPIIHKDIWDFHKTALAAIWSVEEVDFSTDVDDYLTLNVNEKHFVKMILAFFSSSDSLVNMNLTENFISELQMREVIIAYDYQVFIEDIHSECYSLMINNIITDDTERNECFNAIKHFPTIASKAEWCYNWLDRTAPFSQRLIAFAIVEGVFFSGSFCAIFWFKKKNKMKGLCDSNELIARDEGMHTNFACLLYSKIVNKLDESIVHKMFIDAVEIEREFINDCLKVSLIGMNSKLMYQYIKYVSDRLLVQLGYSKIFRVDNPFDFMESMSMEGKTNFFESRPTQYQKASVGNKTRGDGFEFTENF